MVDRFQIKKIRDLLEYNTNGFYVEEITDDYISATHLDDETGTLYKVLFNDTCPKCGEYLLHNTVTNNYICLNSDCLYTNLQSVSTESLYCPMMCVDLYNEQAFKESTLGLVLDDEE